MMNRHQPIPEDWNCNFPKYHSPQSGSSVPSCRAVNRGTPYLSLYRLSLHPCRSVWALPSTVSEDCLDCTGHRVRTYCVQVSDTIRLNISCFRKTSSKMPVP